MEGMGGSGLQGVMHPSPSPPPAAKHPASAWASGMGSGAEGESVEGLTTRTSTSAEDMGAAGGFGRAEGSHMGGVSMRANGRHERSRVVMLRSPAGC